MDASAVTNTVTVAVTDTATVVATDVVPDTATDAGESAGECTNAFDPITPHPSLQIHAAMTAPSDHSCPFSSTLTTVAVLLILLLASCTSGGDGAKQGLAASDSPTALVDAWIEQNQYDQALEYLAGQDTSSADIRLLLEKTHLNNAFYSMSTFDPGQMRTRMNDALRSFAKVLRINPSNQTAREQINQILGVYRTMPGRGPEPDVTEELRALGFPL